MKSFFASKVVDSLHDPHQMTDEDLQLYENVLYFFDSSFTARRAVNSNNLKEFPVEPDCFTNYDLTLSIIKNSEDTLFRTESKENLTIIHRDIEVAMLKIVDEVKMAIDKKWVNKNQMTDTYIFFQEFKSIMLKKSISLARKQ